jgi:hypothetical protein
VTAITIAPNPEFHTISKLIVKNFRKRAVALKQTSFSSAEFAAKKRITQREQFLAEME